MTFDMRLDAIRRVLIENVLQDDRALYVGSMDCDQLDTFAADIANAALAAADAVDPVRVALAAFANETSRTGLHKCEGGWETGYICGFDDEGEPIRGFTEWCRYCNARRLLGDAS